MELPVAPQSYRPTTDALVRVIKHHDQILARTACEEIQLDAATVYTNADRPNVHQCNFAADLTIPEGLSGDQVIDQVLEHFHSVGLRCFILSTADATWSEDLAGAADQRGFVRNEAAIDQLQRDTQADTPMVTLQVLPARAVYVPFRTFAMAAAVESYGADERTASDLAGRKVDLLDEPRLEMFVARLDGRIVGSASVNTVGQTGVIDHVYTLEAYRRRGVARALMTHALDHCRRAMFESVILKRTIDLPARSLYESLGFEQLTTFASYHLAGV